MYNSVHRKDHRCSRLIRCLSLDPNLRHLRLRCLSNLIQPRQRCFQAFSEALAICLDAADKPSLVGKPWTTNNPKMSIIFNRKTAFDLRAPPFVDKANMGLSRALATDVNLKQRNNSLCLLIIGFTIAQHPNVQKMTQKMFILQHEKRLPSCISQNTWLHPSHESFGTWWVSLPKRFGVQVKHMTLIMTQLKKCKKLLNPGPNTLHLACVADITHNAASCAVTDFHLLDMWSAAWPCRIGIGVTEKKRVAPPKTVFFLGTTICSGEFTIFDQLHPL